MEVRIRVLARLVGPVDSPVNVGHRLVWNRVVTGRSGEVEQPGNLKSRWLPVTRAAARGPITSLCNFHFLFIYFKFIKIIIMK